MLAKQQAWLPKLGRLQTEANILSTFDVSDISTEALMFQAGYLTIDSQEHIFGEYRYRLRNPNQEVYQSLSNSLLKTWTPDARPVFVNKNLLGDILIAPPDLPMRLSWPRCSTSLRCSA